jgi:hypothetical protein
LALLVRGSAEIRCLPPGGGLAAPCDSGQGGLEVVVFQDWRGLKVAEKIIRLGEIFKKAFLRG